MPDSPVKTETNKVSVKIPPFWVDKPELWFVQIEAQFLINGITQEDTKFNYIVSQLEAKYIETIYDIIKSKDDQKYTTAKNRLLQTFKESENIKMKKLLTGLELGDMKPSQLLRRMRTLGESSEISDKVLRTLWFEKMPDAVKNVLIISDEDLDKLSSMADKILELTPAVELAPVHRTDPYTSELLNKISALEKQLAQVTTRNSRSARSPSAHRGRRSSSRKRFNPEGRYCYYHFRFGKNCLPEKCKQPCSFHTTGN